MSSQKVDRNERLYQQWLAGAFLKKLTGEFGISRQRIYQVLKEKKVGEKEKVMRAVNKLSRR